MPRMTKQQREIATRENLARLPEACAAIHPSDGVPVIIKRGEQGYFPPPSPGFDPDLYNATRGATPAQVEAMLAGSMFGWHAPAADPRRYG